MYDFVRGIRQKRKDDEKPEYKPTELPEDPYAGGGDEPGRHHPGMLKPGDFGTIVLPAASTSPQAALLRNAWRKTS